MLSVTKYVKSFTSKLRICLPSGFPILFTHKNNNTVTIESPNFSQIENVLHYMDLTNSINFITEKEIHLCLEHLNKNNTDFTLGLLDMSSSGNFFVPVPWHTNQIYMITGYDQNSYYKSIKDQKYPKFGLLQNFIHFDPIIYYFVALFLSFIFILMCFKSYLFINIRMKYSNQIWSRKKIFNQFIYTFKRKYRRKGTRSRLLYFIFSAAFFLLSTPFFLLFKTNLVVTEKPEIISSYDDLIERQAKIYYANQIVNITDFFIPNNDKSIDNSRLIKILNYYLKNRVFYDFMSPWTQTTAEIVSKKFVFMGPYYVVQALISIFCSHSQEKPFRLLMTSDSTSRNFISGSAVRKNLNDIYLYSRLRTAMETDQMTIYPTKRPLFHAYNPENKFFKSNHLSVKQICMNPQLDVVDHEDINSTGISFFAPFWFIELLFILFAFFFYSLEHFK